VVEKVGPPSPGSSPATRSTATCAATTCSTAPTPSTRPAPEGFFAHKPPELSFDEAARCRWPSLTAHQALEALGLRGGESLFLAGGAGGVGHCAIQLAVARGARVVATASARNHGLPARARGRAARLRDRGRAARVRDLLATPAPTPRSTCSAATREQAFACCGRAAGSLDRAPPPEPRDGHRGPLHLRAPERLRDLG
jgi:NADPH:quinone reductase-like Zn-dependent oxidoreductase